MSRCRDLEEHLSLYVDDLLPPSEVVEIRAHLDTCAACAGLVADLSRIASAARLLGPIAPPAGVYANIAARLPGIDEGGIGQPPARRRALGRWAGLAATLVAATALAWVAVNGARPGPPAGSGGPTGTHPLAAVVSELDLAVGHYERAIRELQTVATGTEHGLDPDVAASVRRSLNALDVAIAESRQALETDPASEPARISLFEALRRKIDLLQATALIVHDTQGNRPAEIRRVTATENEL